MMNIHRQGILTTNIDSVNLAIAYLFAYTTAYATLGGINSFFSTLMSLSSYVFIFLVINAIPSITKTFPKPALAIVSLYIVVYLLSYFVATDYEVHGLAFFAIIRFCLPTFFLGVSVRNCEDLLNKLYIVSWFILGCQLFSIFISGSNQLVMYAYSQDTGYESLLSFIVLLSDYHTSKRKINFVGIILAIGFILMSGARGPLMCAGVSFLLFLIVALDEINIFFIVALSSAFIFLLVFYEYILNCFFILFQSFNVSTRNIEGLLTMSISNDSVRSSLRASAWEYALNHPFFGCGFINDRRILHDISSSNAVTAYGTYCHNFYYELLMQFGLVIGGVLGTIFTIKLIKAFSKKNNKLVRLLILIITTVGFLPLMVSRSYLTFSSFYLLVGLLISANFMGVNINESQ